MKHVAARPLKHQSTCGQGRSVHRAGEGCSALFSVETLRVMYAVR